MRFGVEFAAVEPGTFKKPFVDLGVGSALFVTRLMFSLSSKTNDSVETLVLCRSFDDDGVLLHHRFEPSLLV